MSERAELLALESLSAGYGEAMVLFDVSLKLEEGRSLALLGRNGAGKTTLLNSILGLTRRRGGRVLFRGQNITRLRPDERARAGMGWTPQERNIFRSLTVEENITCVLRPGRWTLARLYDLFPRLQERRRNVGSALSGGEQQMLAMARALALNPKLLLLDEPLEGLAPIIVEELLAALGRIVRSEGLSAILVEQSARKILPLTDQAVILERGRIVHASASDELARDDAAIAALLGVAQSKAKATS
jgi:branched-chain amino acid transport system ATP-binding protein